MFTDRRAFVILSFSVLFGQLGYFLTAAALPLYLRSVGAPEARIGLIVGAGSISGVALTLLVGPLISRYPTRAFIASGCGLYLLAAAVMLVAPVEGTIAAGRVIQGLAYALIGPAALAAVPLLAARKVGSVMGLMSTIGSLSLAVGPPLGLFLYREGGAGWLLIPTMAVTAVAGMVVLRLRIAGGGTPDGDRGATPAAATDAGGLPFGEGGSVVGRIGTFGIDPAWLPVLLAGMTNSVYFGGILAYLPLFMTRVHGPNAGVFFTADAVGVLLLRWPSGWLADRTRPSLPMLLGFGITIAGLFAFLLETSILSLSLAGAGTGIGAGLFANGMLTDLAGRSTRANRGTAMALALATASLGVFVGGSISGLLYGPFGFETIIVFGLAAEGLGLLVLVLDALGRGRPAALRDDGRSETIG